MSNATATVNVNVNAPERPTHVTHPTIGIVYEAMRRAGRGELAHYAFASYRDEVAWRMCEQWLLAPWASEATLKALALEAVGHVA